MNSIRISIEATEEQQEILISQLSEVDAEGFEQTGTHLIAYFAENVFKSYEINELLRAYTFAITTLEEKNWNEVWESNFEPVLIERFCAIRAEFHKPVPGVEHEIIITPKMSFGTGHHATTFMMIRQMKEIDFTEKTVLDFGTGTGILAILAEKLNAKSIFAIDIDEWSIANAIENIHKNSCSRISLELTPQIPETTYDVILANINRNVLVQYLSELESKLNENGVLLLSGLLLSDEKYIRESCSLKFIKRSDRGNWISLLFIKSI